MESYDISPADSRNLFKISDEIIDDHRCNFKNFTALTSF